MYAYLRGKIAAKQGAAAIIDVQGVGYRVVMGERALSQLPLDAEIIVHTHLHVREDEMSLYGFPEPEALALFELLLKVSGVGPKLALAITNAASTSTLYQAILGNDLTVLTKIPGVGKKTAGRLVLELKEKIMAQAPDGVIVDGGEPLPVGNSVNGQVLAALVSLGYRSDEAEGALRHALQRAPEQAGRVEDLLKEALKYLAAQAL